jgi:hypothetical protein
LQTRALFLFFACTFLLLTSGEPPHADGRQMYITTQALVDNGTLWVPELLPAGCQIPVFRHYTLYPIGPVIAHVPDYLIYKLLDRADWIPANLLHGLTSHLSPALLMAGVAALLFVILRREQMALAPALLSTLIFGFCTLSFVQARSTWSESLQTSALAWLTERAWAVVRRPTPLAFALLGTAAGVLLNCKVVYCLVLPLYALYVLLALKGQLRAHWRGILLAVGCFAVFVAICMWNNHLKTGSYLDTGYHHRDGNFSGDLWDGLFGLILSSGKGMFWYSPPLILAVVGLPQAFKRFRRECWLLVGVIVVLVVAHAKFRYWNGDWGWGPRYLGPLCPLMTIVAAPWIEETLGSGARSARRWVLAGLVALGIGVNILGASLYWDHYIRVLEETNRAPVDHDCPAGNLTHGHFIPGFSPILGHAWLLKHVIKNDPLLLPDAPFLRYLQGAPPVLLASPHRLPPIDWWGGAWFSSSRRVMSCALAWMSVLAAGIFVSVRQLARAFRAS